MSAERTDNPSLSCVSVSLFGEPRLMTTGGSSIRVKSQKAALLLAYLARFAKQHHSRERLVELLWPDSEEDAARARLRNVLSELRRVLESAGANPDQVITATRTSIEFAAGSVHTDIERFERLLRAATNQGPESAVLLLHEAVELTASEFCSTLYDDWVIAERNRFLHLRHDALNRLCSHLIDLGRHAEAEEAARTLLREDATSEAAYNHIIGVRIAGGDYAAARRHYTALKHVLQEELGTTPSVGSQELIASIPLQGESTAIRAAHDQRKCAEFAAASAAPLSPFTGDARPLRQAPHRSSWGGPYSLVALALLGVGGWATATRKTPARENRSPVSSPAITTHADSHKPEWSFRYSPLADERDSEPTAMGGTPDGGMVVTGFVHTTHNDVDFLTFKLSADGKIVWRARYNGTGNDLDRALAVFVDGPGNIYVTGESDNGKGNGLSRGAGWDIVTVKYDKDGKEQWVRRLNGTGDGEDRPVEFRWAAGNYCVLGTVEMKVPGRPRPVKKALVVAYSAEGKEVWRHVVEENSPDPVEAVSMTSEENGTVMVCGQVTATTRSRQEKDISVTYLSPIGQVVSESRYGKGNGTDDVPFRIASNQINESWIIGAGHTPGTPPSSPSALLAVKYGMSGRFEWARSIWLGADRFERVWGASGSRHQRQTLIADVSDETGHKRNWLVTANAEGSIAWETCVADGFARGNPAWGSPEARVLCNSPSTATWIAIPYPGAADRSGQHPADVLTAKYDSVGVLVWQDVFGTANNIEEPRAMAFGGIDDLYVAGRWSNYYSSKFPPSTIILKYKNSSAP